MYRDMSSKRWLLVNLIQVLYLPRQNSQGAQHQNNPKYFFDGVSRGCDSSCSVYGGVSQEIVKQKGYRGAIVFFIWCHCFYGFLNKSNNRSHEGILGWMMMRAVMVSCKSRCHLFENILLGIEPEIEFPRKTWNTVTFSKNYKSLALILAFNFYSCHHFGWPIVTKRIFCFVNSKKWQLLRATIWCHKIQNKRW